MEKLGSQGYLELSLKAQLNFVKASRWAFLIPLLFCIGLTIAFNDVWFLAGFVVSFIAGIIAMTYLWLLLIIIGGGIVYFIMEGANFKSYIFFAIIFTIIGAYLTMIAQQWKAIHIESKSKWEELAMEEIEENMLKNINP